MFIGFSLGLVTVAVIGAVRAFREADSGVRSRTSAGTLIALYGVALIAWFVIARPWLADQIG